MSFQELPMRKMIKGVPFVRDSFGCYVPEDLSALPEKIKVVKPADCLPALAPIRRSRVEEVMAVTLNGAHQIIQAHRITRGLVNRCEIHPREIFHVAINDLAVSIIIGHNHPSGNLDPSDADLMVTRRIVETSKTIGILVIDHLIVCSTGFTSIRERFPSLFN